MTEIDNLPSGGGSAPTVVSSILWDGNTDVPESDIATLTIDGNTIPVYRISDDVLPYSLGTDELQNAWSPSWKYLAEGSDGGSVGLAMISLTTNALLAIAKLDFGGFCCAYCDGAHPNPSHLEDTLPKAGTWMARTPDKYLTSISVSRP